MNNDTATAAPTTSPATGNTLVQDLADMHLVTSRRLTKARAEAAKVNVSQMVRYHLEGLVKLEAEVAIYQNAWEAGAQGGDAAAQTVLVNEIARRIAATSGSTDGFDNAATEAERIAARHVAACFKGYFDPAALVAAIAY